MRSLQLAPTISTPAPDEVPQRKSILDALQRRKNANIVEGYNIKQNVSTDFPHVFSAEINVDNDRLWDLIKVLVLKLPEEVALIYHHIDDEAKYGYYIDKFELLNFLEEYQIELCQDGYLEFGIIHNTAGFLEEVFVKKAKYLQYWGMDEGRFRGSMTHFELYQIENLNFIDEYPLKTEALQYQNAKALNTEQLITILEDKFGNEHLK